MGLTKHDVLIKTAGDGEVAYVYPGITFVNRGETVTFHNQTGAEVKLFFFDGNLFGDQAPEVAHRLADGGLIGTVKGKQTDSTDHEIYEYVVTVDIKGKKVFAIGASTPRIIIRPSR